MQVLIRNIERAVELYRRCRLLVLFAIAVTSLAAGFFVIGPFIASDAYMWFKSVHESNQIVSDLIDIQGMLLDKLISSTVPLFTVWSIVLAVYCLDRNRVDIINKSSKYLAFFSGSTALIVLGFGFTALGVCLYALRLYGYSHQLLATFIFASMVVVCGLFIRTAARPKLKDSSILNSLALPMLILCTLLGSSAYVYGLVSDPIKYWWTINQAYKAANK